MRPQASKYRPSLHFAPRRGWINDPNGLVYDGQKYHLFAQHNPSDIVWGPMHWLHAISDDLIHWQEAGIALYPNALGAMFSGSAVMDTAGSAGFGPGAMVLVFTQHGDVECQSLAYSLDGVHFELYEGNPILQNPGIRDFRDPKVFWYEPGHCWVMVLAAGDCIHFYQSPDLRKWSKTGEFGLGECQAWQIFECPDLFPLTDPEGKTVWVLMASIGAPAANGGGRMRYYLGDFDGQAFHPLAGKAQALPVDMGPDDYAGVTYSNTRERIYLGWAANPAYAGKVPASDFRGCLTLPRRLSLEQGLTGLRLAAHPLLEKAETAPVCHSAALPESPCELRVRSNSPCEIRLINPAGETLRLGLDEQNFLYTDRTQAGETAFDGWFGSPVYSKTRTPREMTGCIDLRLILDLPLVEIYADHGMYVATMLVFPESAFAQVQIEGQAEVEVIPLR